MRKFFLSMAVMLIFCLLPVCALAVDDTSAAKLGGPQPAESRVPLTPGLNMETHVPYIRGSGDLVRPSGNLTRAEICSLIYSLLEEAPADDGSDLDIPDVQPGSWYYPYVTPLVKMGAVDLREDGSFEPGAYTTRGELVLYLTRFFETPEPFDMSFKDLFNEHPAYDAIADAYSMGWIQGYSDGTFRPDATITRSEAITIVNRALGRNADRELIDYDGKVMLYLDLPTTHWAYYDIMEASLPHFHTPLTDQWGQPDEGWEAYSIPAASRAPGYYNINGELYCVDQDGHWVRNKTIGVLTFNDKGIYTTGNADLDQRLTALVKAQTVAGDSNLNNMRRLHNYVSTHYFYRGASYLVDGQTGWESQMALEMLKNGRGNCYRFAGLETMLARKMGYQATGISGYIDRGWGYVFHGWCQIQLDGKTLICDAQQQNAQLTNTALKKFDLYMRTYKETNTFARYRIKGVVQK